MSTLTPELRDEIKRHLRANPVCHGEVFRAMEQGLDVDLMGTSRANAQSFLKASRLCWQALFPRPSRRRWEIIRLSISARL